jgi:hypothetical protein
MKLVIYSNWSKDIADLCSVTHPNHKAYAARHGYMRVCEEVPYEQAPIALFDAVLRLFEEGEQLVLTHGADVLFMDMRKRFEIAPFFPNPHGSSIQNCSPSEYRWPVTIAREAISFWPINNDVMIWRKCASSIQLLSRLKSDEQIWRPYKWQWQTHLWNLIQTEQWVKHSVNIVPARTMNSTHKDGESRWQLGDFIIHFVGESNQEKARLARKYVKYAGDCTYHE